MRGKIFTFVAASAVAFTVVHLPLATSSATSCDDVKFIFIRGSGQTLEDKDYIHYQTTINAELLRQKSNLAIGFYELGAEAQDGAKYPAVEASFFNIFGEVISGGSAYPFSRSVKQGITELKNYTETVSASCPHTKFVVAGYSQGAMVITNGLSELNPDHFIYAATFGDPKLYLPEGKGLIPSACLGKNLSSYRIYAPNCRTNSGSLGAKKPYVANSWEGKVGLFCKDKDLICGAGIKLAKSEGSGNLIERIAETALSSHTSYTTDGIYNSAAKTIIKKVRDAYPDRFNVTTNLASGNRDTVILLDTTSSMRTPISHYKAEARRLAEETISQGGYISLYTYGDLNDRRAKQVVDWTNDFALFNAYLNSIGAWSDGGDKPESFYSALIDVLNNQRWHVGATKSIIVLTDAPALIPDRDGTTPEQVRIRTLEIDPVNIYLIDAFSELSESYTGFITSTGGKIFEGLGTASTNYLLSRPSVEFPLAEYSGTPTDEFTFTAETTGEVEQYEWDLDFDGVFETKTSTSKVVKQYNHDCSGFIQLKATDQNGQSSTASSWVEVSSNQETEPILNSLKVTTSQNTIHVTYQPSDDTIGVLVSLGEINLGMTSQTNFTITDITGDSTLTLTPISQTGKLGKSLIGEITLNNYSGVLTPQTGNQ